MIQSVQPPHGPISHHHIAWWGQENPTAIGDPPPGSPYARLSVCQSRALPYKMDLGAAQNGVWTALGALVGLATTPTSIVPGQEAGITTFRGRASPHRRDEPMATRRDCPDRVGGGRGGCGTCFSGGGVSPVTGRISSQGWAFCGDVT